MYTPEFLNRYIKAADAVNITGLMMIYLKIQIDLQSDWKPIILSARLS